MYSPQQTLQIGSELLAKSGFQTPRLDCELMLAHVLQTSREKLYGAKPKPLSVLQWKKFNQLLRARLIERKPIALMTGKRHFFKHEFAISPGVFVPRPETELLVEKAIELARSCDRMKPLSLIDVCTGSGSVALSVLSELADIDKLSVEAIDISPLAIACITHNADNLLDKNARVKLKITQSNLFLSCKSPTADIIMSNPPYLSKKQMADLSKEVINHDPLAALYGGEDGLVFIRKLVDDSKKLLRPGGHLLFEIADDQCDLACEVVQQAFHRQPQVFCDLAGKPRVLQIKKEVGHA